MSITQQDSYSESLRFEKILAEVSATFVNLPATEVDANVDAVLGRFGSFLGVDRIDLMSFQGDVKGVRLHSWAAEGLERHPESIPSRDYPGLTKNILKMETIHWDDSADLPSAKDRESLEVLGIKAGFVIPFGIAGKFTYALGFGHHSKRSWPEGLIQRFRLFGEMILNALQRKESDLDIRKAFDEIRSLKEQAESENIVLREELDALMRHKNIIGESDQLKKVLLKVEQVAKTNTAVLVLGETGTGKELVARAIHEQSPRKNKPMVTVNCGALPANLVESELFGHEKGAFTGASARRIGRFQVADGSTIFLDEVGDMPMELQVKLLRVLQEGKFEPVGSSKSVSVDVRVIAATNIDVEKAVQEGVFRQDLYYRLNVFPINNPPLRERTEDIPLLASTFVQEFAEAIGVRIDKISKNSVEAMKRYAWPGNIRELRNVIERAVIVNNGGPLVVDIPDISHSAEGGLLSLEEYERRYIKSVLKQVSGRIRGKGGAAEILDLKPTTLYSKMKKLDIEYGKRRD
jgi:formate hydrogenlyase transcriptional activator